MNSTKYISEGIAEAIGLILNNYNLTEEKYDKTFDAAADVFVNYVETNSTNLGIHFDASKCEFSIDGCDITDLLNEAEQFTDEWIENELGGGKRK